MINEFFWSEYNLLYCSQNVIALMFQLCSMNLSNGRDQVILDVAMSMTSVLLILCSYLFCLHRNRVVSRSHLPCADTSNASGKALSQML